MRLVIVALCPCNPEPRLEKELRYLKNNQDFSSFVIAWNRPGNLPSKEMMEGATLYRIGPALPAGFGVFSLWRQVISKATAIVLFSIRATVQAIKLRPNLIYIHDLHTAPIGILVKAFTGAKLIYDAHEDYPFMLSDVSKLLGALAELLERIVAPFVDYVVAVDSDREKKFSSLLGRKTILVRNYPEKWFTDPALTRSVDMETEHYLEQIKALKESGYFIVLSSSFFWRNNGLEEFLLSKAYLKPDLKIAYVLIGWGNYGLKLKKMAEENHITPVIFAKIQPYQAIPHFLRLADVGVDLKRPTPYYLTIFPTKISEYIASGVPVICGRLKPISSLIDAGCGLFVDTTSPASIAQGIEKLATDKLFFVDLREKTKAMGESLKWENQYPAFDKMFGELTSDFESN